MSYRYKRQGIDLLDCDHQQCEKKADVYIYDDETISLKTNAPGLKPGDLRFSVVGTARCEFHSKFGGDIRAALGGVI